MKVPIYLRIAKTNGRKGYKVAASSEPNSEPLSRDDYRGKEFFPTVAFCVSVDVPEEFFKQAERVIAELNIGMKEAQVSTEIVLPKGITVKKPK